MRQIAIQKKTTHINSMRTERITSRIEVMLFLGIDDQTYGHIVYNEGIRFLNSLYEDFEEKFIAKFEINKGFWSWWKLEWTNAEQTLLRDYRNESIHASVELFKKDMQRINDSTITVSSFANFLKLCKDVKL